MANITLNEGDIVKVGANTLRIGPNGEMFVQRMANPATRNLPPDLIAENGGAFGFVCIWRKKADGGDSDDSARRCTVGDWLTRPENQSGTWLIDGGWGGPPGPIHVRWNEAEHAWENGGYCGRRFEAGATSPRP